MCTRNQLYDITEKIAELSKNTFGEKLDSVLLYGSMVLAILLTTAVIEVPFLASAFGFKSIGIVDYAIAIVLAFLVIPIVEIVKAVQRKAAK